MKKRAKKKRLILYSVTMLILIGMSAGCGFYLYNDYQTREQDQQLVDSLKSSICDIKEQTPVQTDELKEAFDDHLLRRINFEELQAMNQDISRWLFVPNTKLDAPVVNEPEVGKYFYDLKGYNKRYNGSGSFLVPKALDKPDGTPVDDGHLLILGHRMNNYNGEWQFSNLPLRWGTRAGADEFPYVYIYYPDHAERWRVWMGLDIRGTDRMYDIPLEIGSKEYGDMLTHIQRFARYQVDGIQVDKDIHTMMWSTCNYASNNDNTMRFVLVSVPDAQYYYDTNVYIDMSDAYNESKWKKQFANERIKYLEKVKDPHTVELTPMHKNKP